MALNLQLYQQGAANPAFTTNIFTTVAVTKYGLVWAGTLYQGFYRLDTRAATPQWVRMPQLTQEGIRDIKPDRRGGVWIAQTGLSGSMNGSNSIVGGMDYYDSLGVYGRHYGHLGTAGNLQTRAARSTYVAPDRKVWVANAATLTGGVTNRGGASTFQEGATQFMPFGSVDIPGADVSCQAVSGGGTTPQVWVAMTRSCYVNGTTCFSTRLVRFSAAGTFLGFFDNTNSPLPISVASATIQVRAIHFDDYNRAWVGLNNGTFGVFDLVLNRWTYHTNATLAPAGSAINANAISSDARGNVYIGTSAGLLVYQGGTDVALPASYTRYTTASGLPSDNVTGIAVVPGASQVWLSTSAGLARWSQEAWEAYHLAKPRQYIERYNLDASVTGQVRVAADNSETTLFRISVPNVANLRLRLRENPQNIATGTVADATGFLTAVTSVALSAADLWAVYRHPAFVDSVGSYNTLHLELYENFGSNRVVRSYKVRIVRPPLLLLHGLWSKGADAFPGLKSYLVTNRVYESEDLIYFGDYMADRSLATTTHQVRRQKDALLTRAISNGVSAGRVDIIGHSMGGLVSRNYIQSGIYADDVNRLITLNTPHSGSPLPNIVRNFYPWVKNTMNFFGFNPYGGALNNLSLKDSAINLLNAGIANHRSVPVHAITTTKLVNLPSAKSLLNARLGYPGLVLGCAALQYAAAQPSNDFLRNRVFRDENDLIVGLVSQKGGLSDVPVPDQSHIASAGNPAVQARIQALLRENPRNSPNFSTTGFTPAPPANVGSDFERQITGPQEAATPSESTTTDGGMTSPQARLSANLRITSPTANAALPDADSIRVVVTADANVTDIILLCGGAGSTDLGTRLLSAAGGSAYVSVPRGLLGRIKLAAMAFVGSQLVRIDTLSVQRTTASALQTVRVEPEGFYVSQGDSTQLQLTAAYANGRTYNITGGNGVSFAFQRNQARITRTRQLLGLTVGTDSLRVSYGGRSHTVAVQVRAAVLVVPLPVTTWTGTASTDWFAAANWSAGVPTADYDVVLPTGRSRYPVLPATLATPTAAPVLAVANGLTLQAGSSLTLQGSSLYLYGNLTTTGGTLNASTGTVGLLGERTQTVGGTVPLRFAHLTVGTAGATLAGAVEIAATLRLEGNLTTNGRVLTLLSDAAGTALVVNEGPAVVRGDVTVQRYLAPGATGIGPAYRLLAAPVGTATVARLGTAATPPVVNPVYNTAANPAATLPYPTAFAYNELRLSGTPPAATAAFDRGWESPAALTTALVPGRGYRVQGTPATLAFTGPLHSGPMDLPLTRGTSVNAGWHLLGNPYAAPLNWNEVVLPIGFDQALYSYAASSATTGGYGSFVNGIGLPGSHIVGSGQGFLVRVSPGSAAARFAFSNDARLTSAAVPPLAPATDARPVVQLALQGAGPTIDALFVYAQTAATAGRDPLYDAVKLPNSHGLNLGAIATTGEALAISALSAVSAGTVVPLTVAVAAAGTYTLRAEQLLRLPAGLTALLTDATTGQSYDLRVRPTYSFTLTPAQAAQPLTGRFSLRFGLASAVRTWANNDVQLFPNPAQTQVTVTVPAVAGATQVRATLFTVLGQAVREQKAALPAAGGRLQFPTTGLPAGVYLLRLQAGTAQATRRLVVE